MSRIQFQASGLCCTFLLCNVLFGLIAPTSSSILLSRIKAQPSASSTVASANGSLSMTSTYTNYLSSSDPTFARPGSGSLSSSYHYNAIQVTASISGYYDLTTTGSLLYPYSCLYDGPFNPSYPSTNQVACSGDSFSHQSTLNQYLPASSTYYLVVTSYSTYGTGWYTVTATGSGSVYMSTFSPDIYKLAAGIIAAIVIGSIVGCVVCVGLIVAIFNCLCRRSTVVHQTIIPAQYNPAPQAVYYPPHNPYGSNVKM